MRVLVVTTWFPSQIAPTSGAFVVKDVNAIQAQGHDVRLIHLVKPENDDGQREFTYEGIRVTRLPYNPLNPVHVVKVASTLRKLAKGADVLHSMAVSAIPASATIRSLPWVHTEHWSGLTNPDTRSSVLNAVMPIVRFGLARPDIVTAVCEYLAAPIREIRGKKPVAIVPCIVPPVANIVDPPAIEGRPIKMVTIGGLIDRKDPAMCIKIAEEIANRGRDVTMTFVGDGPLRSDLEEQASKVDRAEIVFTGNLDRSGVERELAAADVFIGPTKGDNFFVSCAESISAGRPVVVSDKGGQGEYVKPIAGEVLSDADAADYADAVLRVISANHSATDIAASLGDDFHAPQVGAGYAATYEEAVNR